MLKETDIPVMGKKQGLFTVFQVLRESGRGLEMKIIFESPSLSEVIAWLAVQLQKINSDFRDYDKDGQLRWQVHYQVPGDCLVLMFEGFLSVQADYFKLL